MSAEFYLSGIVLRGSLVWFSIRANETNDGNKGGYWSLELRMVFVNVSV